MSANKIIKVVVGILENDQGEVLIAQRQQGQHLAGLWEFPGGKVETHETSTSALQREFEEELGIQVKPWQPLILLEHQYPDKTVQLDVWQIKHVAGQAFGKEGQRIKWLAKEALENYSFPAANETIIKALKLPRRYLITPEFQGDEAHYLQTLERALKAGISLLQLRCKEISTQDFKNLVPKVERLCHRYNSLLLLNSDCPEPELFPYLGVHLSSSALNQLSERPRDKNVICAASCHNQEQVTKAQQLNLDFICLSPVLPTRSHVDAQPMGWQKFAQLCSASKLPVFALGGLKVEHQNQAIALGAHGVAAISAYWNLDANETLAETKAAV